MQGNCRRRTGHLSLTSELHSEGLQALARLYCSDKQRLGHVPYTVPTLMMPSPPSEGLAARQPPLPCSAVSRVRELTSSMVSRTRKVTFLHVSGSSNTSAAEIWRCTYNDPADSSICLSTARRSI